MATRFGDFMLKEDLGSSRVADRFAGMHDNLGGPFFIKKYTRLTQDFTTDLAARCEVLMRIKHHVLAPHLGHGDVDGIPFVVSPLLDGADLLTFAESLRARRVVLPLGAMLFILREVARGVEALHTASDALAHGNVTARHVRIGVNGEVWITGLSTPRGEIPGEPPDVKWDGAGVAATTYDLIGLTRPTRDRPPLPLPLDRLVRRALGIGKESDCIGPGELAEGIEEIASSMSLKLHQGVLAEVASRTHAALLRNRGRTAAEKLPTLEPLELTPTPRPPTAEPAAPPPRLAPAAQAAPPPPPKAAEKPNPPQRPVPPTEKVTVPPRERAASTPTQPAKPLPPPTVKVATSTPVPPDEGAAPRAPVEPAPTRPLSPILQRDLVLPPDEPFDGLGAPPDAPTAPQERIPHPDEAPSLRATVESPRLPPPPASEEGLLASFNDADGFSEEGHTRPEVSAAPKPDSRERLTLDPTVELQGPVSSSSDGPDLPFEVDSTFRTGRPPAPEPPNPDLGRLFAEMGSPAPMPTPAKTMSFLVDPLTEATNEGVATVPAGPPEKPSPSTAEPDDKVAESDPPTLREIPSSAAPPPPTLLPPKMSSKPQPPATAVKDAAPTPPPAAPPAMPAPGTVTAPKASDRSPTPEDPLAPPVSASLPPTVPQDRAVAAFLRTGRLSNTQLEEALAVQRARGGHIVDILVSQGVVSETAVADTLADEAVKQRIDAAALQKRRAQVARLRRMPEPYALSHCVLVLDGPADGPLTLAMADPFDKDALAEVRRMFGASLVQVQVAERTVLKRAIQSAYGAMATPGADAAQPTLMLCTNDDEQVTTIGARLAAEGFAVAHAATGTLATRLLKKNQPNAILCDYALPGAGEDVLLATRQLVVAEEIPFFMYGDDPHGDVEARCLDLGADDFFSTPFKLDVVLRKIRRAIVKNSRKMRAAPVVSQEAPPVSAPPSMFELAGPPPGPSLGGPLEEEPTDSPIPEEFGMVVTDVPAEPTGVMGTLKQMAVSEIVQSLEMGRKTARVELVPTDADAGRFWFDSGQIVYAEVGELKGEDAFYQLARHTEGFFRISYGDEPTERNIEKPTTFLLLEAMRLMDEEGQL